MESNYFIRYIPLLIHIAIVCALAGGIVVLSTLVGQHKRNPVKMSPYECGMLPVGDVRQRFSVKFYLVAMLFILFDVEAVFLFPWAILLAGAEDVRLLGDGGVHRDRAGRPFLHLEERRAGLEQAHPERGL